MWYENVEETVRACYLAKHSISAWLCLEANV